MLYEELEDLWSAPNIVKMMRVADHVACRIYRYGSLVGNPEGKRLIGIQRCSWKNNIKEKRYADLE